MGKLVQYKSECWKNEFICLQTEAAGVPTDIPEMEIRADSDQGMHLSLRNEDQVYALHFTMP